MRCFWAIRRIDRDYVEPTLYKSEAAARSAAASRQGYDVLALRYAPAEESAVYPDWRPIETAPRDGTNILLICADAYKPTTSAGWWGWWNNIEGWQSFSRPEHKLSSGVRAWFPTHWQPMPTLAPAEARGSQPEGER